MTHLSLDREPLLQTKSKYASTVDSYVSTCAHGKFSYCKIKSLTSGETPSSNQFFKRAYNRVSVQGVDSLWGDCRFIPAVWGVIVVDLCYFALFEDFSL